ncbi:hypothetical protein ABW20_dc0100913 [Dactylellina cionopaga]|nr:hypothetical protein ABW20_dc0100913 [Dactylellina cionopaga]
MRRQKTGSTRYHSPPKQTSGEQGEPNSISTEGSAQIPKSRSKRTPQPTSEFQTPVPSKKPREGMVMRSAGPRAGCEQRSENIDEVVYNGWKLQVEHICTAYPKEPIKTREPGDSCLYVCHKCLKYTMDPLESRNHDEMRHQIEHPRGVLVHSFDNARYQIYEIDGAIAEHQAFLQRMCLFGKFFIQNKSIWYEFDNFLFYVLVEKKIEDTNAFSHCGFFSKEKTSYDENNLSCIILYPPYRSKGLGSALIEFSYYVSKLAGRVGGPEKPISELGKRGYTRYWTKAVATSIISMTSPSISKSKQQRNASGLRKQPKRSVTKGKMDYGSLSIYIATPRGRSTISIEEISRDTGIAVDDVLETLALMGIVKYESSQPTIGRRELRAWLRGGGKPS